MDQYIRGFGADEHHSNSRRRNFIVEKKRPLSGTRMHRCPLVNRYQITNCILQSTMVSHRNAASAAHNSYITYGGSCRLLAEVQW
jgi:hypothetical protein